jgi:hypothetical protein
MSLLRHQEFRPGLKVEAMKQECLGLLQTVQPLKQEQTDYRTQH